VRLEGLGQLDEVTRIDFVVEFKHSLSRAACYLLHPDFLLGLCFDAEDRGDIFHRNFG
jgi:hypothetical protein